MSGKYNLTLHSFSKENNFNDCLTPSAASMNITTPSHNLIAAVTSSEKFT